MKKTLFFFICGLSTLIFLSLTLRPVPHLPEDELTIASGTVDQILEGSSYDIVFKIREIDEVFYINRGLEQGLVLQDLRDKLVGNQVTFKYPEYWSLLNNGYSHHLSKVVHDGEVIFSSFAD